MQTLRVGDARQVLDFVSKLATLSDPEPFPAPLLAELIQLIPSERVDYFEGKHGRMTAHACYGSPGLPELEEAHLAFGPERPTAAGRVKPGTVQRLSGCLSRRGLSRLGFYREVMRPGGIEDELKLRLRCGETGIVAFGLDASHRFSERDRIVLALLEPHLRRRRERAAAGCLLRAEVDLTEREWEVLGWVARGKTNKEIADLLLIRPGTVRKHLEHCFDKMGVQTRTAAVARAFGDPHERRRLGDPQQPASNSST